MTRFSFVLLITLFLAASASAQFGGGKSFANNPMMNSGHFYGKVIDSTSGKPVEFASVQLWGNKKDSVTNKVTPYLITGMITQPNGDFSFDNLPVMGTFTLKINFIGYKDYEQKISFNLDMNKLMEQAGQMKGKDYSAMLNLVDKDLGNIKLSTNANQLGAVVVEGSPLEMELKFDKRVFNVEKSFTSTGGTAEDVLKNVPSVTVDIDGNVKMRNAAPQIFVDGRPTTLSIDQIPADAIESIELITNPSAKYDASGGQGGILNIVMKKSRKIGYNGNVRAGVDQRGRMNIGGDINLREGKVNIFVSGMYNQRKSIMDGHTDRYNYFGNPLTNVFQDQYTESSGYFTFGRAGLDWFPDNRNTITISGSYPRGNFEPVDELAAQTDTILPTGTSSSYYRRNSYTSRNFSNAGGSVQYKHLFPKAGKELTADFNYNSSVFSSGGNIITQYYDAAQLPSGNDLQKQSGSGDNSLITSQVDYVNPIGDKMKIESGLRASIKNFESLNYNFIYVDSLSDYTLITGQNNNYKYIDQVYAGYLTFSHQLTKFSYQAGLRVESSLYEGELIDSAMKFTNQYPLSFFPSASATYSLGDKGDFQFSYSRRVNRPNFFQLSPYIDYSDSLNLNRGNPGLKPEFTHSLELSYLKNFDRSNSILVSAWYKYTMDLITRYQVTEYDEVLGKDVLINTYQNAESSTAYGLELTSTNSTGKWLSLITSFNFYNSVINGTNLESGLTNQQFSWLAKENATIRLPKNFSIQLTGSYQSKTALPLNSGGGGRGGGYGGGGGGMMFGGFGGAPSTVQGYVMPVYFVDAALKYEFLKNKAASLTLSVSDVFKTRESESVSESDYFTQNTLRKRDQQLFRLNFSYRFGKFDVSLFKRKNTKVNLEGLEAAPEM